METRSTNTSRLFFALGALLTWGAVLLQLYLALYNRTASIPETLARFFTFFTILSNTLAAVCFTSLLRTRGIHEQQFFSKSTVFSAVTVYIMVVCLVYQVALRPIWNPQGLQKVVDELLHSVNPVFFVVCWIFFVSKHSLQWKHLFQWLAFPFVYLLIILIRGAITGYYPYPFVNVVNLGYGKVFINCGIVLLVFLVFSAMLIGIGRFASRSSMVSF
ncbi:MAG: Pr6Pr family membrane protein [Agriterribacter sp.]